MKKIIVTLGPASLGEDGLKIAHKNNYIYRINGAHSDGPRIENIVRLLREKIENPEILVDLPGNKIRTANLGESITVKKDKKFVLNTFNTNYPGFVEHLNKDQIVYADDSTLSFKVLSYDSNQITFSSYSDGELKNGKGLHIRGIHADIPFLFEKDIELINVANKQKISYIGLSFVRDCRDIDLATEKIDKNISIIPKVETLSAVQNINKILGKVDHILIDRGDLSTEVGISKVPLFQNYIIKKTQFFNKEVYLATQFLKNMEKSPLPTIAEITDLYNTLKNGVKGIQLSEETAVGEYPQKCLSIINQLITEISEENINNQSL